MKSKYIFTALAAALLCSAAAAESKIKVNVKNAANARLYLGYRYEDKFYKVDSAVTDRSGNAVFKFASPRNKGIYFLSLSRHQAFDFLMPEEQSFAIEIDTLNRRRPIVCKGSRENDLMSEYQRFILAQQAITHVFLAGRQRSAAANNDSAAFYDRKLDSVEYNVNTYIDRAVTAHKGTFFAALLPLLRPFNTQPDKNLRNATREDSILAWQAHYAYVRDHHLDGVNLGERGLIYTPFFKSRIDYFLRSLTALPPDTIAVYLDGVIAAAKKDANMYQYLTETFFKYYQQSSVMTHDAVVMHIIDRYYLSGAAQWADSAYLLRIEDLAKRMRPTLIGSHAPDLHLQTLQGAFTSLDSVKAEFTVVCFFEPSCGHCQKELPLLWELYQKVRKKGVEVFAVYTDYKKAEWEKFVHTDNHYDWINVWDGVEAKDENGKDVTYSVGSNFLKLYNIRGTPLIVLLDRDKKVVARGVTVETLQLILERALGGGR